MKNALSGLIVALSCALSASLIPPSSAAANEPVAISTAADSNVNFPSSSLPSSVGPNSHVMLMDVPDWIEVSNSKKMGRGMWMFPLSSRETVQLRLKDGVSGDTKFTAIIYVDATGEMIEKDYLVRVSEKAAPAAAAQAKTTPAGSTPASTPPAPPPPAATKVAQAPPATNAATSAGTTGSTIEFPIAASSPDVARSENIMLIDVPDTLTVEGGTLIGKGLWLVERDNVGKARLVVQPNATGSAKFRVFAVGAGGTVHSKKDVVVDLAEKKLVAPQAEEPAAVVAAATPPAAAPPAAAPPSAAAPSAPEPVNVERPASQPPVAAPAATEPPVAEQPAAPASEESNSPQESAAVDWKKILERQKKGEVSGELPENQGVTPQTPASGTGQEPQADAASDAELLVMARFLIKECTTCHNVYAKDVGIPVMAGLTVERFIDTMDLYRRGKRANKVMESIANSLSDKETRALALYLARIKPGEEGKEQVAATNAAPVDSEQQKIEYAKVLVRECTTCHSLYGNDVGIPVMIGLPVDRFIDTMDLYRRKKRNNLVMQSVADSLSDDDTHALALYLSRIKPASETEIARLPQEVAASTARKSKRKSRQSDPSQLARIAGWIERAQSMLDNGNIASARLLLERAAEYGDAGAALLIASSYDPNVLRWDPTTGIVAEPLEARRWYLEAKALGAGPEVDRRLSNLPASPR